MSPKITIITPTYYRPDFLRRCIISIQNQTFKDYEHFIISDHCPYAKNVYNDFRNDKRIKYYEVEGDHVFNYGAIGKSLGIKLANGDFICYCDDDNFFLPHHLQTLNSNIESNDAIFSLMGVIKEAEQSYDKIFRKELYDFSGICHFSQNEFISCMHKKNIINDKIKWKPIYLLLLTDSPGENGYIRKELSNSDLNVKYIIFFTCVYTGGRRSIRRKEIVHRCSKEYSNKLKHLKNGDKYVYPLKKYKRFDSEYGIKNFRFANRKLISFVKNLKSEKK